MKINHLKNVLQIIILFSFPYLTYSQTTEKPTATNHFNGSITVTNNGISFIPTFSLGKPAIIFDLSVGKRLSFDPQLRFALEGKPWSFLFWWRYKLITNDKFRFTIGAHPALSFRNITISNDGGTDKIIMVHRYLAGEFSPNYFIANNISIGAYYLFSHGFDKGSIAYTHFLTLNSNFSGINLSKQFYLRFNPQIYYLKMDKDDGYYFSSSVTFARRNFPVSVSAMINKVIKTEISASKDFVWNASIIYSFSNQYIKE